MSILKTQCDARLAHMQALSEIARAIALPIFNSKMDVTNKAGGAAFDPVTEADIEGERAMRAAIRKAFPDDGIEGEELPDHVGSNDFSWTLDPIDGTRAFVAGVPVWSTLIALSFKGEPVLGLIDCAAMDVRFWGETVPNETPRAWRETASETQDLRCRTVPSLQQAVLGCTEPLAMLRPGELAAYNIIRRGVAFSRLGLDAFGYGLVASGKMDIIIEGLLKPCDVRALMPVIHGAGGRITNWEGGSPVDGGRVVCTGSPELLPELYTYLGRAMDDRI